MSVSSSIWPYCFLPGSGLASYLRTARHLPGYLQRQGRWPSFLYSKRLGALLALYLVCLFHHDCAFFLPKPADDCFHAAGARRDPAIPSFVLLASPTSSPCLDANEEVGLRATESPDCLTLQLCQTNQMWGGEPSKLLVAKGY